MTINPIEVQCPHCGAGNRFYRAPNIPDMCVYAGKCQHCDAASILVVEEKTSCEGETEPFTCRVCGDVVPVKDYKPDQYETLREFGMCLKCYNHPDNWGNE